MEIIVDAYSLEEQSMGWYYYLEEKLCFPFTAFCNSKRSISPLQVKDEVNVVCMAPEGERLREMLVTIIWEKDGLAFPLSQLTAISSVDKQTKQAVEDWHYWVKRGTSSDDGWVLVVPIHILMCR